MMLLNPYRFGGGAPPSNITLSLAMSGADGGTTFTDASANHFAVTANGGITTQTTGVPSGGSGGGATVFDGVNDNLSLPNNAAFNNFGTGDFLLSVEVYCTDISAERVIASCVTSWTGSLAYNLEIRSGGDVRFYAGDSAPLQIFSGAGGLAANTWQAVKVQRVSGTTTLTVDNVSLGTHSGSVAIANASQPAIGIFASDNSAPWQGYMRNFVITKG